MSEGLFTAARHPVNHALKQPSFEPISTRTRHYAFRFHRNARVCQAPGGGATCPFPNIAKRDSHDDLFVLFYFTRFLSPREVLDLILDLM